MFIRGLILGRKITEKTNKELNFKENPFLSVELHYNQEMINF